MNAQFDSSIQSALQNDSNKTVLCTDTKNE